MERPSRRDGFDNMNPTNKPLTHARLLEVLSYDRENGIFTWRIKLSPRGKVGTRAGTTGGKYGYRIIWIDGVSYQAGRVAWFYEHGRWPKADIDHTDGDRSNDRLSNLREATRSENNANRRLSKSNRSGFKGVSFNTREGMWRAAIAKDGKKYSLGSFKSPEEAHRAYCAKAETLHGKFARVR